MVDDLLKSHGSWLSRRDTGVVISSRLRLARNMRGHAFPGWARDRERVRLCGLLREACRAVPPLKKARFFDMADLSPVDREVLLERHLISRELAEQNQGSGLLVADDERVAIMINEEDHLRMQAMSPGSELRRLWQALDTIDTELESRVRYAFSLRLGYLTACPSNVGSGLRASMMLHLSGLRLTGEVDAVVNGLDKLGLTVRGLFGEGTEAHGNMFQVSNQSSLGEPEEAIIERLAGVVDEVVGHEHNARARLLEKRYALVVDHVARAFALLKHARLLSSEDTVELLSGLRLGVDFDMVSNLTVSRINDLLLLTQPGHLQKHSGRPLEAEERDEARASLVREKLKQVSLTV